VKSRQWINDVTPTKGGRINEHFSTCWVVARCSYTSEAWSCTQCEDAGWALARRHDSFRRPMSPWFNATSIERTDHFSHKQHPTIQRQHARSTSSLTRNISSLIKRT
jgi:hypothetical protein